MSAKNKKVSEADVLNQKIKELTKKITNQKAHIFDIMERKIVVMNEQELCRQKIESLNKEIISQQRILDGDRKILNEKVVLNQEK
jgi:hypothetical protein